ncbi:MAG: TolC family protein [Terrimicrobiaceae bacterium]
MSARAPQAAAWDDPRVSADFNAARFVEVPANAFMDQTVTLEQMIPSSGKNMARRPEIRTAEAQVEAEKEKVRLSRREWIPDPAISVQAQRYNDTQHIPSELNTGVSFSIPRGHYEKYSAGTREARSNLAAAQAESDRVQKESLGLLRDQLQKIEAAHHHAELFEKELLSHAEKAVAVSRSAYESGKGEFSDWIAAQRLFRDAQATALNHLTDHQIAIAELEGIVGAEIRPTSSKTRKPK